MSTDFCFVLKVKSDVVMNYEVLFSEKWKLILSNTKYVFHYDQISNFIVMYDFSNDSQILIFENAKLSTLCWYALNSSLWWRSNLWLL